MLKRQVIVGIDEVGKGSLFGPVFAGAVILGINAEAELTNEGLKDSKLLTAKRRARLVPLIQEKAQDWGLGQASSREIDSMGIRKATELAMLRALQRIENPIDTVLVDGILPIRLWKGKQKTLVRGESKSIAIAAASVLAKETRDALIKRLSNDYPEYGLKTNVGYGTKLHREVLLDLGPTPLHRQSFLTKIFS